jgi:hypothetical protein
LEFFDIIKIIFENPDGWKDVTSLDKKKIFFAINRRFSINYPMQVNVLQHLKINPVDAMDYWQHFLSNKHNKTPYWMYAKGVKKTQETKEKKINISQELIDQYCRIYEVDKKSIEDALVFFPDETIKELKMCEKMLKN